MAKKKKTTELPRRYFVVDYEYLFKDKGVDDILQMDLLDEDPHVWYFHTREELDQYLLANSGEMSDYVIIYETTDAFRVESLKPKLVPLEVREGKNNGRRTSKEKEEGKTQS